MKRLSMRGKYYLASGQEPVVIACTAAPRKLETVRLT